MEALAMLIGIAAIYSTIHFFIIQHSTVWEKRTSWEKVVTVAAMVFIGLIFLGSTN